jgi:hypothetical protein
LQAVIDSGAIRLTVLQWLSHMRDIVSPIDGIRSPFGVKRSSAPPPVGNNLLWGAGNYLVWGAGNYLIWG